MYKKPIHSYVLKDLSGAVTTTHINLSHVDSITQHRGRNGPVVEVYFSGNNEPRVFPYDEAEYNALVDAWKKAT